MMNNKFDNVTVTDPDPGLPVIKRRRILLVPVLALLSGLVLENSLAADIFNGREVYGMHCAGCHGENGVSMIPGTPDFSGGDVLFRPDTELYKQIREGTGMMPAYRGILQNDEIRDVIAYLRSLQR